MDVATFQKVVARRQHECSRILTEKAGEYARGDRLSNFKKAAAFRNTYPEDALQGMNIKHLISLEEMIEDLANEREPWAREKWEEKITDAINYFMLLEALLFDRYGWAAQVFPKPQPGQLEPAPEVQG
jgi:hypothetical protein